MEFNAVTKEIVEKGDWSSVFRFSGTFSKGKIPCTGEYREFHGNSSVVSEGEQWLERVTFTPEGCTEQVTAYFNYTDHVWGSGWWKFEEGPNNRTLWRARPIWRQEVPMFEEERRFKWIHETKEWILANFQNGERIWKTRSYSKWLREPNVRHTIEDILQMGCIPSEEKSWRQCAEYLGFGPQDCGLSVPRFEYAISIARLIA